MSKIKSSTTCKTNPLLYGQNKYLSSLPTKVREHFFSDDHVDTETRAQVWSEQAELGERCVLHKPNLHCFRVLIQLFTNIVSIITRYFMHRLVNQYAWATPDPRALKILKHFASQCNGVIEIGCGANAYWARQMNELGIDVLAFDSHLKKGGKIDDDVDDIDDDNNNDTEAQTKKRKIDHNPFSMEVEKTFDDGFSIYRGGPEVLSSDQKKFKDFHGRVLFLCYPDEDIYHEEINELIDDEKDKKSGEDSDEFDAKSSPSSLGAACLEYFKGDFVIHVGEHFGDTLSLDHAPWGRSSGPEFQQRLHAEYHCLLKAKLTSWIHVKDSISVWKRSKACSIVFQGEDDDEDTEETEYKYVPKDEMLPSDIAAPCVKHLL